MPKPDWSMPKPSDMPPGETENSAEGGLSASLEVIGRPSGLPPVKRGREKRKLQALERQNEVCRLRMLGWGFDEIAAELGYAGKQGPYEAFKAAMANYPKPDVEEFRSMFLTGWLQVWRANLPYASGHPDDDGKPTTEPSKDAADSLYKASTRIEAILGLAVKRVEVTGKDGAPLVPADLSKLTDEELERLAGGFGTGAAGT